MSRTNIILLVVLVVVAGAWWMRRDSADVEKTRAAPRMFPDFNKEAADRIVIEGGWKKDMVVLEKLGSAWTIASAGGYPVKAEEARKFVDAVASLRSENLVGETAQLAQDTRTDEANGRLVTIFKSETPVAEFRIGKNPKRGWEHFFVRPHEESKVYRTRTILSDEFQSPAPAMPGPFGQGGARGFDWDDYTTKLSTWVETRIWNLDDVEVDTLNLTRPGELEIRITNKGEDKWELVEPNKEPVPADAAAVDDIKDRIAYLSFEDVVGAYEDGNARKKYGLDKPAITLKLTLKKTIKKEEPAKEGDDKEKKKEEKPETITIRRIVEVGKKVKRPVRFDADKGEVEEEEFYAIRVSGDQFDDKKNEEDKVKYIYLVRDYTVRPLKKTLEDLVLKEEEKKDDKEGEEGGDKDAEGGAKKKDDDAGEKKKDDAEGGAEKKDDAGKKDDAPPAKKDDAPPAKKDDAPPPKKKDDG